MQINKCKMQRRLVLTFATYLLASLCCAQTGLADDPFNDPPAAATPAAAAPVAKPVAKQKLLERKPFDTVTLTASAGGATLEVQTITLPQRPLATQPTTGLLKVRVLDR